MASEASPAAGARAGREAALQALYQVEIARDPLDKALADVAGQRELTPRSTELLRTLARGVTVHRRELDERIGPLLAHGWGLDRLALVELLLLRIAAFELLFLADMPPLVTISEAARLARRYVTPESSKFIQGLLGSLLRGTEKANWQVEASQSAEPFDADEQAVEPEPAEELIQEGSPEHEQLQRAGRWTIRRKDPG